jgi:hypothetical protein
VATTDGRETPQGPSARPGRRDASPAAGRRKRWSPEPGHLIEEARSEIGGGPARPGRPRWKGAERLDGHRGGRGTRRGRLGEAIPADVTRARRRGEQGR